MKDIPQAEALFKQSPEDFIVEEIRDDWHAKVSVEDNFNKTPDVSALGENPGRDFISCELEKRDIDLFSALKILASHLHKGVDSIGYAGIKDKRAHTCQRITIFKPDVELIKTFKHENIYLKNFKWEKRKIKMGYLDANRFKITLREIDKKDAIKLSSHLRRLKHFSNLFGKQRFGSVRGNNAKLGKLLVKRKFKEFLDVILEEVNSKEQEEVTMARIKLRKEKDYKEALSYFPQYLRFEMRVLDGLAKGKEPVEIIKSLERKSVLMYVHALQSHIFNIILEKALEQGFDFTQKGQQKIPLFGYRSKIDEGDLGEMEVEVLKNEGIELRDFNIMEIPYLRIKGDLRNALVEIMDLDLEIVDEDAPETKTMVINFTLKKGTYATTFLENFFLLRE